MTKRFGRNWSALFFLLMLPACAFAFSGLKVGVYNIHGGVGTDGRTDLARIGRVLQTAAPDVIALNEVNRYWLGDNHDEVLAGRLGPDWKAYFGKTLTKWYAAADYGNAIITRLPVVSSQTWLFSEYSGQERRGMIRVTVEKDGEQVHIFNTHMGLDATMRQRHAREILTIMAQFPGHKVLVGDFNEQRTGTSIEILAAELTDCGQRYGIGSSSTFSATNPTRRIDFIWLGDGLAATSCYVPMFDDARVASDHLPVFADIATPETQPAVINSLATSVNGHVHLSADDSVPDDPEEYTQGSVVLSTSGASSSNEIIADNLLVQTLVPLHTETFTISDIGGAPQDWKFLYQSAGKSYAANTVQLSTERFWRQRSEGYVKFHYAPAVYPQWKNYEVSARIKMIDTGGGEWRLWAYNYPGTDTAYETYKIAVRHNAGALPILRIMKGATQLASTVLADHHADPYDWINYSLQINEVKSAAGASSRQLAAFVNGKRVAAALDTIAGAVDPTEYSQGSVGITTIGGTRGWCEIFLDDLQVRQWQDVMEEDFDPGASANWKHLYTTAGQQASGEIAPGLIGNGWRQSSDGYTRYHFAPTPYPEWENIRFSGDVRTLNFGGGKWRMTGYNYPSNDLGYETYKLEVNVGTASPLLRIMKGGIVLNQASMQTLGIDPMAWQQYELSIRTHRPEVRIIDRQPVSIVPEWNTY